MTAQEKEIIIGCIDRVNPLINEQFKLTVKWFNCDLNGCIPDIKVDDRMGGYSSSSYESTYAWIDGYTKGIVIVQQSLRDSYSPASRSA
jgi:hypothetical protein